MAFNLHVRLQDSKRQCWADWKENQGSALYVHVFVKSSGGYGQGSENFSMRLFLYITMGILWYLIEFIIGILYTAM